MAGDWLETSITTAALQRRIYFSVYWYTINEPWWDWLYHLVTKTSANLVLKKIHLVIQHCNTFYCGRLIKFSPKFSKRKKVSNNSVYMLSEKTVNTANCIVSISLARDVLYRSVVANLFKVLEPHTINLYINLWELQDKEQSCQFKFN